MKQLELKDGLVELNGESTGTRELIETAINHVPQGGGLTPVDMRKRIRILDVLGKANATLELEDADATLLCDCVDQMRWAIVDRGILSFCDAIDVLKNSESSQDEKSGSSKPQSSKLSSKQPTDSKRNRSKVLK